MKYILFSLLILTSTVQAQLSDKQLKELQDNTQKMDSVTAKMNESINASMRRMDSVRMENDNRQNERNLNSLVAEMKERDRKAKKGAFIRIGFGILLLIVLIVGLRRKKKQQN